METLNRKIALAVFAVLVVAAPLLFGAADRIFQIGLTILLGFGFLAQPPEVPKWPRTWKWAVFLFISAVIAKEFLPAAWFGIEPWQNVLTRDYALAIPPTHNPEPARALDTILAVAIGSAFFVWVRTLAAEPRARVALAWTLASAAFVFAVVCLAMGTRQDFMIYGWRYTPGWTGFGPFPNRNHTAAFLAMGALAGCGCTVRAGRRKNYAQIFVGFALIAIIFVALVQSKSRGGLIGFGFGLLVFGVLTVARIRTRAALVGALGSLLISAGLLFAFGAKLLARFNSPTDGNVSNQIRRAIWRDTIAMWKHAPLHGFGLDTFSQLFPFYQAVRVEDAVVLHPESSWLLWLVELGAIPVCVLAVALLYFLIKNGRDMFVGERGFYIRAGALAAVAALLCHSIYDVPAHRWATAGFGLALLAIACPPRERESRLRLERSAALIPFAIAAFWLLPVFSGVPDWSPTTLAKLLAQAARTPTLVSAADLRNDIRFFPLNADLHEALGLRYLTSGATSHAWNEFRAADRLDATSWQLPATQAWISQQYSPGMARHFWSVAIERSGHRAPDIFPLAYKQTEANDGAKFWASYTNEHPEFLTIYADQVSDQIEARAAFEKWWIVRANADNLTSFETKYFYYCASKWGTREQFDQWMKRHPELEAGDFKSWANLLHHWNDDAAAWALLTRWIKEPSFPQFPRSDRPDALQATWFSNPENAVNAQAFAFELSERGEIERSRNVIFKVADSSNPPAWFLQKAAYLYAASGDYANAVRVLLRDG